MIWTATALAAWVVAVACTGALPQRPAALLRLALVAGGVPLLGLLTLTYGPVAGLGGLVLGTVALGLARVHRGRWPTEPQGETE